MMEAGVISAASLPQACFLSRPCPNLAPTLPQPCPNLARALPARTLPEPCFLPGPCPNLARTLPQPCPRPCPNLAPSLPQPCVGEVSNCPRFKSALKEVSLVAINAQEISPVLFSFEGKFKHLTLVALPLLTLSNRLSC